MVKGFSDNEVKNDVVIIE